MLTTQSVRCYNLSMKEIHVCRKLERNYDEDFLCDFINYCRDFYRNLFYIKKYYKQEFDSKSENAVSIDAHIEMFLRTFKQIVKAVNSPSRYESLFGKNKTIGDIFDSLFYKFSNLKDFHSQYNYLGKSEDLINEKYYSQMAKLSNIIFTQEEIIALTTQKLWKKHIAKSINDIKKDNYCCLVKVLSDWRMETRSKALDKYMESRYAMSVSLVTHFKSRFFDSFISAEVVGIIYSTNKIIAGSYKDAFLEEFVDGKCPLEHQNYNSIRQTDMDKNHTICSYASKIATPHSVLRLDSITSDTYNEVIIDRRESAPIAVFYVKHKKDLHNYDKQAELTAQKMAKRFNLPLVELEDKNLLIEDDAKIINLN